MMSEVVKYINPHQIGLSRTSVTNIESGKQAVLLHQVYDIARALDTTVQALLPDDKPASAMQPSSVDDSVPEGVRKFLSEELAAATRKARNQ